MRANQIAVNKVHLRAYRPTLSGTYACYNLLPQMQQGQLIGYRMFKAGNVLDWHAAYNWICGAEVELLKLRADQMVKLKREKRNAEASN